MNKWENGYAEFIPTGTRESNRRMIKQLGNSSFYKSEGEKESSYSLHLNVAASRVDPVGEMFQQFQKLTAGERKEMPQMPEGSEGRMLYDDGSSLKVWLDTQKGEVSILARLECSPLIERQLLQVQADMGRCIGRYRDEICKPINK
ncbi:MAG: hypothetical protein IKO71_06365 [Bacteroidaceae bacterium]|nr:hypothetical protein [Bacteroidaceae bacterium]